MAFSLVSVLGLLPTIVQVLASIPTLVKAAEEAFGSGTGEQKKKFVTDSVSLALDTITSVAKIRELNQPGAKDAIVATAGKVTDAVVGVYNTIGVFRKGGDPSDVTASGGR